MIIKKCSQCKNKKEFTGRNMHHRKRCDDCLAKYFKRDYPMARCSNCEKIYKLNFYPLQSRHKMKETLLCDDCKLNGTKKDIIDIR